MPTAGGGGEVFRFELVQWRGMPGYQLDTHSEKFKSMSYQVNFGRHMSGNVRSKSADLAISRTWGEYSCFTAYGLLFDASLVVFIGLDTM